MELETGTVVWWDPREMRGFAITDGDEAGVAVHWRDFHNAHANGNNGIDFRHAVPMAQLVAGDSIVRGRGIAFRIELDSDGNKWARPWTTRGHLNNAVESVEASRSEE